MVGKVIPLKSKKKSVTEKYFEASVKQGGGLSYSDLAFLSFYETLIDKMNVLMAVNQDSERDKELCKLNIIALMTKALAQYLVAIHTKRASPTVNYSVEAFKRYFDKCYEDSIVEYLAEDSNPFDLDNI